MTLDELQALCDKAFPGPWTEIGIMEGQIVFSNSEDYGFLSLEDHKFITAAREYIPKLIAELKDTREQLENAKWCVREMHAKGQCDDHSVRIQELEFECSKAYKLAAERLTELQKPHECLRCMYSMDDHFSR